MLGFNLKLVYCFKVLSYLVLFYNQLGSAQVSHCMFYLDVGVGSSFRRCILEVKL